jgi:hypothetical protein
MNALPKHIENQLQRLLAQGLPTDKIAFMMGLRRSAVEAAKSKVTKVKRAAKRQLR